MIHGNFDIPNIEYFINHNSYTGSQGLFQYKIEAVEDGLRICYWSGMFCFEKSKIVAEQIFTLNQQGLLDAIDWLEIQRKGRKETKTESENKV